MGTLIGSTFRNALDLRTNGTTQYAYRDNPSFKANTQGAFSIWYRPTTVLSADGRRGIIGFGSMDAVTRFWWLTQRWTTAPAFPIAYRSVPVIEVGVRETGAPTGNLTIAHRILTAGELLHIVVQSNGSTTTIYINGVLMATTTWLGTNVGNWLGSVTGTDHRLTLGCEYFTNAAQNFGNQDHDEVTYFDRPLTSGEITALYNGGTPMNPHRIGFGSEWKTWLRCGDSRDTAATMFDERGSDDFTLVASPSYVPAYSDEMSIAPSVSVGDTTARISFGINRQAEVSVKYSTDPALAAPLTSGSVVVTSATDYTGTIDITGLSANTTYYYAILVNGVYQTTSSFRSFKTFVANGAATSFSFAFGSCTAHYGTVGSDTIFDAIPAGTRFFLHLGDLIYADVTPPPATTLALFRSRMQTKLKGAVSYEARYKALRGAMPVYTTWDDHDITGDYDQGPLTAIYLAAKQATQEYVGAQNPNSPTAGELYYTFQYGDVGFFVLDSRSFRSTNVSTDDGSKTQLGSVQLAALKAWLLATKTTLKVKVICTSTPMHGYAANTGGDSFGGEYDTFQVPTGANGYRTERNDIWDYIDTNQIPGVIAISGDQHWAGAFKTTHAGRARYEFMSSPLNQSGSDLLAPVSVAADPVNGPVFFKYSGANNVGVVTIDTSVSPATVSFQLYGTSGSLGSGNLKAIDTNAIDAGL